MGYVTDTLGCRKSKILVSNRAPYEHKPLTSNVLSSKRLSKPIRGGTSVSYTVPRNRTIMLTFIAMLLDVVYGISVGVMVGRTRAAAQACTV